MRRRDENFLTMVDTTIDVMNANSSRWETNTAVSACVDSIVTARTIIGDARQAGSGMVSTGTTRDKDTAEADAIDLAVAMAGYAQVYARRQRNNELQDQMKAIKRKHLQEMADNALPDTLKGLHQRLTALGAAAQPYGVTTARLTALMNKIMAYEALMDAPRGVIVTRKGVNSSLPAQLKLIREELGDLDLLMNVFEETAPAFVTDYRNARIVIDRGGGHGEGDTPPPTPGS